MTSDVVLSFRGTVEALEKELIPKIWLARIRSDDGKYVVEMDMHEDLVVYDKGSKIEFTLSRSIPQYREGIDFVGKATMAGYKEEGGMHHYLLSIGGLVVIIHSREKLDLKPLEKLYIKVARVG